MQKQRRESTPFGKEIKKRLIEMDLRQVDFARMIGIRQQHLNDIIAGVRPVGKYAEEICETLSISYTADASGRKGA